MVPWRPLAAFVIVVANFVLLRSLHPWHEFWAVCAFMAALGIALVAAVQLCRRRGPTAMQLVLWLALASSLPIAFQGRSIRTERLLVVGSERLLHDAQSVIAEFGPKKADDVAFVEGNHPSLPASLRSLKPRRVRVTGQTIEVIFSEGLGWREWLEISGAPIKVVRPLNIHGPTRHRSHEGNHFSERELAPGILWKSWAS